MTKRLFSAILRGMEQLGIPESVAVRVFNRIFGSDCKTMEEAGLIANRPQMFPFKRHLEACHECGKEGLCEIGQRLRAKGLSDGQ